MPYMKGVRGAVAENLTGSVFHRLTVLSRDSSRKRRPYWVCKCECGAMKSIAACELKSGKTKSCGCYDAERKRTETVKHGFNRTPTYVCWSNMLARCTNPKRRDFKNYGGRGISVCERWRSFENFLADMGEKPPKLSLDRVDNDANYGPDNCRWATASEQRLNQRSHRSFRAAAEIGRQHEHQ